MFANTSEPKQTAVDNNESFSDTELDPLKSEVEWAINSLKDRKSPGCNEITAEMIKTSRIARIAYYHKICMKIWNTGEWPEEWKRTVLIILPKKGDLQLSSNHRTILLISHPSKIMLKIIMKRMKKYCSQRSTKPKQASEKKEAQQTIF